MLCEYSHPSFKGWSELMTKKEDTIYISSRPEFISDYASECIGYISWIALQSINGFIDAFKNLLDEDMIKETNKLRPKILEMVTRHFEVRIYNKKMMMKE